MYLFLSCFGTKSSAFNFFAACSCLDGTFWCAIATSFVYSLLLGAAKHCFICISHLQQICSITPSGHRLLATSFVVTAVYLFLVLFWCILLFCNPYLASWDYLVCSKRHLYIALKTNLQPFGTKNSALDFFGNVYMAELYFLV